MLDHTQLLQRAPSIFTEEPYFNVSDQYKMVRTYDVVKALQDIDFVPVAAGQTRVRAPGRKSYAKHLLRFRHRRDDRIGGFSIGDEVPEAIIWNSHDGTSTYGVSTGIFRFACMNGMFVKSAEFGEFRIKHKGAHVVEEVVASIQHISQQMPKLMEFISEWKKVPLEPVRQLELASSVLNVRYVDRTPPILAQDLLAPRRYVDNHDDLWSTFNRIQENVMRGGVTSGLRGPRRRLTTRAIRGTNEEIRFNREAWAVAEDLFNRLTGKSSEILETA